VTYVWSGKSNLRVIPLLYKLVPSGNVDKMDSLVCQVSFAPVLGLESLLLTYIRSLLTPLHPGQLSCFSTLFTGSLDGQVRTWNINTRSSLYTCKLEPKNVVTFNERLLHSPPASPRKSPPPDHLSSDAELKESIVSEKGSRKVSFASVLGFF
jgi:hypothetical protein